MSDSTATATQAKAYKLELDLRKKTGLIPAATAVVSVPDPASVRVGSGGATLNALVVLSQHLCAQVGQLLLSLRVPSHVCTARTVSSSITRECFIVSSC